MYRTLYSPQGGRIILDGREVINMASNNYLGLANHPAVVAAAKEALEKYGVATTASRNICGNYPVHDELEEKLILADVGGDVAVHLVDKLRDRVQEKGLKTGEQAADALRDIIADRIALPAGRNRTGGTSVNLRYGQLGGRRKTQFQQIFGNDPVIHAPLRLRISALPVDMIHRQPHSGIAVNQPRNGAPWIRTGK